MVALRKPPRTKLEVDGQQLTLGDWERDQAGEAQGKPQSGLPKLSPTEGQTKTAAQRRADSSQQSFSTTGLGDGDLSARRFLTVAEVGRVTGLSANAVYRAIWSGELRASKLRGRLRVRSDEVEAWADDGRVSTRRVDRERPAPTRRSAPADSGRGLRELLQSR
jgi:excisionase family DNA binding protein